MKICTVVGARPQFVKAAALSAKFAECSDIDEIVIHTGQHYDPDMSKIFFEELAIPREKYNLEVGSGSHGAQTGRILEKLEEVLQIEKPDFCLLYGDTNSTLAGALAAAKLHIPVAHVEAGTRSFNRKMPEEVNRVVTDHLAGINFCPTTSAFTNLQAEGREAGARIVGDVMYDCVLRFSELAERLRNPLEKFGLKKKQYFLLTCHRPENTNYPDRMKEITEAVNKVSERFPVVYPVHPRTKNYLSEYQLNFSENVILIPPVSYLEMLVLEKNSLIMLTDSGGMQKESFFFRIPCVTLRDQTEWVETLDMGWNVIVGADKSQIIGAVEKYLNDPPLETNEAPYGNGDCCEKIVEELRKFIEEKK